MPGLSAESLVCGEKTQYEVNDTTYQFLCGGLYLGSVSGTGGYERKLATFSLDLRTVVPSRAHRPTDRALHCTALHCTALTALHCTALTALHCTALHCTALHCTHGGLAGCC
jgi:hypothetical protein